MMEKATTIRKNGPAAKTQAMDMVYGKVPPHALEMEEAVLGSIMLQRDAYDEASRLLTDRAFYTDAHQRIFRAMTELSRKSQPIDINTVTEQLRSSEDLEAVGGSYYVAKLTNTVVSAAHNAHYCRIIVEKYLKRELIRIAGSLIGEAYEDSADVFETMDEFEKQYTGLSIDRASKNIQGLDVHLVERIQRITKLRENPEHLTGIPSGYAEIDQITHGWQKKDLIILAARPSVGKTAFALNLARNASMHATKAVPVALFSLEMSTGQLVDRLMAAESEIWLEKIMNGMIDDHQMKILFTRGIQPLGTSAKIFIDDTGALNVFELRARCRMLARRWSKEFGHSDGLIIIDYLQLMSGMMDKRNANREQEISHISRELKALAKELNMPIIALSQLSREPEKRKGESQRPKLSDLRESGAIEQDADVVMFMYRPEYYEIKADESGESTQGLTFISISKHRNGKLAQGDESIRLRANLAIQKFYDWKGEPFTPYRSGLPAGSWRPVESSEKRDDFPF